MLKVQIGLRHIKVGTEVAILKIHFRLVFIFQVMVKPVGNILFRFRPHPFAAKRGVKYRVDIAAGLDVLLQINFIYIKIGQVMF